MRGPADATFGTVCCHVRWAVPPITMRSPDAGVNATDRPPPFGRSKKRRAAPRVSVATRGSGRSRGMRSPCQATLSRPLRYRLSPTESKATSYRSESRRLASSIDRDRIERVVAGPEPRLQDALAVHHAIVSLPSGTGDQLLEDRVGAGQPRRTVIDPRPAREVKAHQTGEPSVDGRFTIAQERRLPDGDLCGRHRSAGYRRRPTLHPVLSGGFPRFRPAWKVGR